MYVPGGKFAEEDTFSGVGLPSIHSREADPGHSAICGSSGYVCCSNLFFGLWFSSGSSFEFCVSQRAIKTCSFLVMFIIHVSCLHALSISQWVGLVINETWAKLTLVLYRYGCNCTFVLCFQFMAHSSIGFGSALEWFHALRTWLNTYINHALRDHTTKSWIYIWIFAEKLNEQRVLEYFLFQHRWAEIWERTK